MTREYFLPNAHPTACPRLIFMIHTTPVRTQRPPDPRPPHDAHTLPARYSRVGLCTGGASTTPAAAVAHELLGEPAEPTTAAAAPDPHPAQQLHQLLLTHVAQ